MAAVPLRDRRRDAAATIPTRPEDDGRGARAAPGRVDPGHRRVRSARPDLTRPRLPRGRGGRARAPTGWCSGPGRGSPRSCRTCWSRPSPTRSSRRRRRRLLTLNLEVRMGETARLPAEDHLASCAANAPDVRLDVVLADPSVVPTTRPCGPPRPSSAPSSSSRPWRPGRAGRARPPAAAPAASHTRDDWLRSSGLGSRASSEPARTPRRRHPGCAMAGWPHGDDGKGEGRARAPRGDQDVLSQGRGRRRCCGSPAACTSSGDGSSSRPSSTPAHAARRLRRNIAEVYGHESDIVVLAAGGLRTRHPLRRPGRQGRRGPGPPDRAHRHPRSPCARSAAAGRHPARRATPRPRGAAPSWPTARSPSRAARRRSR